MYATNPYATNNGTCTFGNTSNTAGFGWNPAYANAFANGAGNGGAFLAGGVPDCCGVTGFAGAWGNPFNAWNAPNYGFGAWNGVNAFNANWNSLFNGTPNYGAQNLAAQTYGFQNTANPYAPGFGGTVFGTATNGWTTPLPGWLTPSGFVPANAFALRTGVTFPGSTNGSYGNAPTGFAANTGTTFATPQGGAVPGWFTPASGFATPNGTATAGTVGPNGGTTATSGTADYACTGAATDCGGASNIKVRSVA